MPSAGIAISPALLKLDPIWDPLRGDPRFQALLKQNAGDSTGDAPLQGGLANLSID